MNDQPTAPQPAPAQPPPPPPPPPAPATDDGKAGGGLRALAVLMALVLGFGAAVMFVAGSEIADTPTQEQVLTGEEALPSDGEVFDGSEGKRSFVVALLYASGVAAAVGAIAAFAFTITGRRGRPVVALTLLAIVLAGIALIF
jgi:hypothetical protein